MLKSIGDVIDNDISSYIVASNRYCSCTHVDMIRWTESQSAVRTTQYAANTSDSIVPSAIASCPREPNLCFGTMGILVAALRFFIIAKRTER